MPGDDALTAVAAEEVTTAGGIVAGVRVIWQEAPVALVALCTAAALRGLVPAATMVLTGRAVAAIPGAAAAGGLSGSGRPLAVSLAAIVALHGADMVADHLLFAAGEGWGQRLYGRVEQRAMRALLAPPLTDHLLDADVQRTADLAMRAEWPNIFPFAANIPPFVTWLVGALTQAVLVASFSPALAVVTTAAWLAVGGWVRRQELDGYLAAWEHVRYPHYFRELSLEHRSAGEVRAFGLGPWLIRRFDDGWREGMAIGWARRVASGRRIAPLLAVLVTGTAAGLAYIASAGAGGHLSPSQLAVVLGAYVGLTNLALPQHWTQPLLRGATRLPALFELEEIAAQEVARTIPPDPVSPSEMPARAVRFEGVSFAYPGRRTPVLRGLDLTIEAGRSLAIVGVNGAGKTTLVKLLARLHDPTEGRAMVDGVDLRALDPVAWQARAAAIFQDYLRLPLSVAENVALRARTGRPEDEATLEEAAAEAGAAQVIAGLPRGWDTVLSRRYSQGTELSGGEWQRVALARALHAVRTGAGVLVLDEPTANLDARGEAELFERFLAVTEGTTSIVISHRFSTVRRADRIVVLDEGRVTEDGSHDELVALGGRYAELFALQASRYVGMGEPVDDEEVRT